MDTVNIAMLGAGFVSTFYMQALHHVRGQRVVSVLSGTEANARSFAEKWGIAHWSTTMDEVVDRSDVDLVVVGLPHHLHVEAVTASARAGKGVICTKPLGRSGEEALQCYKAVTEAGVWHGYAETEPFVPAVQRAKTLVDAGAIGRVYWVRAREAHSSPHKHAMNIELMGGGPLRGLGIHGVAVGRWFTDCKIPVEIFCWGDRLVRDDVESEDNALMLMRFDDGRLAQVEAGWGHKAGLDVRTEIHGDRGYISTNHTGETGIRAFTTQSAGYILEKATIDTGWINPVPDEAHTFGYQDMLDHLVHHFRDNQEPWQTLRDGAIDNCALDAAYRSMKSGTWEKLSITLE
jgi:predicted dehydrogenase